MSVGWIHGSCPKFEISDEELEFRMRKMKPAFMVDGKLTFMVVPHPRDVSFTWEMIPLETAVRWREAGRIETHHRCGYIGLFKPSIAEVLAQVPSYLLEQANAFETLTDSVSCYGAGNGHRAITVFYVAHREGE